MNIQIKYNSPVILSFAISSVFLFLINNLLGGALNNILILSPHFNFSSLTDYISLFTYTLGHSSIQHLFGNLSLLLIIGPIIEEKYGSTKLLYMMSMTALITAVLQIVFMNSYLLGASGIVFMLIILASFTRGSGNGIPLTFVLVLVFYLGNELTSIFIDDNISRFAHIAGGVIGSVFGLSLKR